MIGGFITWIFLKKQFKFERKLKEHNRLNNILKSLIVIKREIKHNVAHAKTLLKVMNKDKNKDKDLMDFSKSNLNTNFLNVSWIEFNNELVDHELKVKINKIENFYHNISFEINNNILDRFRLKKIKEEGTKCNKNLNENIEFVKEKIDKIDIKDI